MKLKQWLREYKQMAYADYRNLPDEERWKMIYEFNNFNRRQNLLKNRKGTWRPMTEEEKIRVTKILEKERQRYETNLKIGGIDERGNYTALHQR